MLAQQIRMQIGIWILAVAGAATPAVFEADACQHRLRGKRLQRPLYQATKAEIVLCEHRPLHYGIAP